MKRRVLNLLIVGLLGASMVGSASQTTSDGGDASDRVREPLVISRGQYKASTPMMALGPDGSMNMIWVEKLPVQARPPEGHGHSHRIYTNLYFARSTDDGRSFSKRVQVNGADGSVWGFSTSIPQIAVDQSGTIHIFYSGNRNSATAETDAVDARYTRSTDRGRTFEPARTLNTVVDGDQADIVGGGLTFAHCFGSMDSSPDGTVFAAWIDTRHMTGQGANGSIYGAISRDGGKTFEPDRLISRGTACPCCQLDVAFSPRGRLYVSSRNVFESGARNSAVMTSSDYGKAFSEPVRLTTKDWKIEACPLKPAIISTDDSNRVYAAWFTAAEDPPGVYFAASRDGGKTFADPQLMHPGAKISDHPQMAIAPDGGVYVVWDAVVEQERRVYLRVSNDHGKTFGRIEEFGSPVGSAKFPSVAVGGDGSIFLAWQQDDSVLFQRMPRDGAQTR